MRGTTPVSATIGAESGDAARLSLAGDWTLAAPLPDVGALVGDMGSVQQVNLDASALGKWDSVLPAFLFELATAARAKGAMLVADSAPEGLQRLLAIALAVPPRTTASADERQAFLALSHKQSLRECRGNSLQWYREAADMVIGAHQGVGSISHAPIGEILSTKESCKGLL